MAEPRHRSWVRVRCAAAQLRLQLGREQLQQLAPVSLPLLGQLQRQARIAYYHFSTQAFSKFTVFANAFG